MFQFTLHINHPYIWGNNAPTLGVDVFLTGSLNQTFWLPTIGVSGPGSSWSTIPSRRLASPSSDRGYTSSLCCHSSSYINSAWNKVKNFFPQQSSMLLTHVISFCWGCCCFWSYQLMTCRPHFHSLCWWLVHVLPVGDAVLWPHWAALHYKYFSATNLEAFCFSHSRVCQISLVGTFSQPAPIVREQPNTATFFSISWLSWFSYSSRRLCCVALILALDHTQPWLLLTWQLVRQSAVLL